MEYLLKIILLNILRFTFTLYYIFNIFRNICLVEYSNYKTNNNLDIIEMSEECSKGLSDIIK